MATCRCSDRAPEGLREGITLFNRGEYFECHEVLEEIWRAEPDPVRALYQGILQIGVAFYHLHRENWRGAVKLLDGGTEKVARFTPRCLGVDTDSLNREARECLARLRELGPERVTEFDWSLIPAIMVESRATEGRR